MKNVLFFLTPKNDVAYIKDTFTIRQAMEKMKNHNYTAIPIISAAGKYIGTITEGDFLWGIKEKYADDFGKIESAKVSELKRRHDNVPVNINANMDDLIEQVMNQNFVPVVMDDGVFIGIVTRKAIIEYYVKLAEGKADKGTKLCIGG